MPIGRHHCQMTTPPFLATEINLGDRFAPVEARINRRAKRLIVRVDSLSGIVHVTAPSKRAVPEALNFARERASWIRAELQAGPKAVPFAVGGLCPYRGKPHLITRDGGPRAPVRVISSGVREPCDQRAQILVGGDDAHTNRRVCDWLKRQARLILTQRVEVYSARLNVRYSKIRIVDTRSRWGSCSEEGTLSFSWRLILAPDHILDYVAAHECAHLVHMNHSKAYWRLLASLDVDARASRDWFRQYGADLFGYGFQPK